MDNDGNAQGSRWNSSPEAFADVGYVVLPDLISSTEARQLSDAFERVGLHTSQVQVPGASSSRSQANERALLQHPEFLEPLTAPRLHSAVEAAIGRSWQLLAYEGIEIVPGGGKPRDWHCDFHYPSRSSLVVNVGIYLQDMVSDRGPLYVLPGSHNRNREPDADEVEASLPGEVAVTVTAGSAVVFHGRTWHTASTNASQLPRRALFAYFGQDWISRMDDFYLTPLPDHIANSDDPVIRKMFGLDPGTVIHGATYTADNADWQ